MELWIASTSPFARKVRIAACELGLTDAIALVEVDPWTDQRLRALNPAAKVPTLVTDQGEAFWESGLICEYLDTHAGSRLHPPPSDARWRTLRIQAIADAAMTAAGRLVAESRRDAEYRSIFLMRRFEQGIEAALNYMEGCGLGPELDGIGEIACAAFVGYLDFRWPDHAWRRERPNLRSWFERVEARPSLTTTRHGASAR